MRETALRRLWLLPACAAAACVIGGCAKNLDILQYPAFYQPDLKTIAVLPFRSASDDATGWDFAEATAAALGANGTYKVLSPGMLSESMSKSDFEKLIEADPAEAAAMLAKLDDIDLLLTGTVTVSSRLYRTVSYYRGPYYYPRRYYYHGYGYRHPYYYPGGYYHYGPRYDYYSEAAITATAVVYGVADARRLYGTVSPIVTVVHDDVYYDRGGALVAEAADDVIARIVSNVAIVPTRIKVKPKETLHTASEDAGGVLRFTDRFSADAERMHVVVTLPSVADHNAFRIDIVPKGTDNVLAEETFVWSRLKRQLVINFSPRKLAEQAGTGKYTIRFYSGGRKAFERHFRIE